MVYWSFLLSQNLWFIKFRSIFLYFYSNETKKLFKPSSDGLWALTGEIFQRIGGTCSMWHAEIFLTVTAWALSRPTQRFSNFAQRPSKLALKSFLVSFEWKIEKKWTEKLINQRFCEGKKLQYTMTTVRSQHYQVRTRTRSECHIFIENIQIISFP